MGKLFLCPQKKDGGFVFEYDIGNGLQTIPDYRGKFNDGKYHVVRFIRDGEKAMLYIDDKPVLEAATPQDAEGTYQFHFQMSTAAN